VKTHVLRYWEQEFEQLSPIKRRGNRRYYQRKDVLLVRQIKELLYAQGFTIEGAKTQILRAAEVIDSEDTETSATLQKPEILKNILADLEGKLDRLAYPIRDGIPVMLEDQARGISQSEYEVL